MRINCDICSCICLRIVAKGSRLLKYSKGDKGNFACMSTVELALPGGAFDDFQQSEMPRFFAWKMSRLAWR